MSSSAPRSGIRLTFWNCNGLSTYKVRQLTRFARVTEVAALALCETKRPESQLTFEALMCSAFAESADLVE